MCQDVKLTAANDDQYFVFEDYLYQVRTGICFHCLAEIRLKVQQKKKKKKENGKGAETEIETKRDENNATSVVK